MERMGGKEQLLEQMYAAMATQKDETVDLALRSYGKLPHPPWATWQSSTTAEIASVRYLKSDKSENCHNQDKCVCLDFACGSVLRQIQLIAGTIQQRAP